MVGLLGYVADISLVVSKDFRWAQWTGLWRVGKKEYKLEILTVALLEKEQVFLMVKLTDA